MKKIKKVLALAMSLVMLISVASQPVSANNAILDRYEKVAGLEALVKDAEVYVYSTKEAGTIKLTDSNIVDTTFSQGIGFREYTATPSEGWVWKGWKYEQFFKGEDLGNRTDWVLGTRYSFSNDGDDWYEAYNEKGKTISVNRLTTCLETVGNKITYKLYANFNPTIEATAEEGGMITDRGVKEVEYGKNEEYVISADEGKDIASVMVDGQTVGDAVGKDNFSYTFENVVKPHSIYVTFKDEEKYTVTYTDGVENEVVFTDETYEGLLSGTERPAFEGTLEREDYVFAGWTPELKDIVTENITYTATWEDDKNNNGEADKDEEKYTVTYTDGVENEVVFTDETYEGLLSGTKTPMFEGTLEREDYVFAGWTPELKDTVTGNITYTATWEDDKNNNGEADKDEEKYTVTYTDGVENEVVFTDETYEGLLSGTERPAFEGTLEREDYVFAGWTPELKDTVTGNITYTATWEKVEEPVVPVDPTDPPVDPTDPEEPVIPVDPTNPPVDLTDPEVPVTPEDPNITVTPEPETPAQPTTPEVTTPTEDTPQVVNPVDDTPAQVEDEPVVDVVEDEETPLANLPEENVDDNQTPLAGLNGGWALVNLICTVVTVLFGLFLLISKKKKEEDEEEMRKRGLFTRILSVVVAIASVIVFFLTEDLTLKMVMTDKWTLLMVVFALVQVVIFYVGSKWKAPKGNKPQQQTAMQ